MLALTMTYFPDLHKVFEVLIFQIKNIFVLPDTDFFKEKLSLAWLSISITSVIESGL